MSCRVVQDRQHMASGDSPPHVPIDAPYELLGTYYHDLVGTPDGWRTRHLRMDVAAEAALLCRRSVRAHLAARCTHCSG
jgi:hypothetical protein